MLKDDITVLPAVGSLLLFSHRALRSGCISFITGAV